MNRRRFLQLMGGAGVASTLPLSLGRAAEGEGAPGAYPISERDAVIFYGKWRPKGKPPAGTWGGVSLDPVNANAQTHAGGPVNWATTQTGKLSERLPTNPHEKNALLAHPPR